MAVSAKNARSNVCYRISRWNASVSARPNGADADFAPGLLSAWAHEILENSDKEMANRLRLEHLFLGKSGEMTL